MCHAILLSSLLFTSAQDVPGGDALLVQAALSDSALDPERGVELSIRVELAAGWRVPENPLLPGVAPGAMLQILAPPEVELEGPAASTLEELLASAFLDLPYERMVDLGPGERGSSTVPFHLLQEPSPEAALELSFSIYAARGEERPGLVRQRYRLSLSPGAHARRMGAGTSAWGKGDVLQLGDVAPPFELPTAFGPPLALADVLGKGFVVVTTHRSCL